MSGALMRDLPADWLGLSVGPGETRVARVQGGRLVGYDVVRAADPDRLGRIYRGRVVQVDRGLGAVLVDLGDAEGFLGFEAGGRGLAAGAAVGVQVVRAAEGDKRLGLATRLELAGRFLVAHPALAELAVARRIGAARRTALRAWLQANAGPGEGWTARSAAAGATDAQLAAEMAGLRAAARLPPGPAPRLLWQPADAAERAVAEAAAGLAVLADDGALLAAVAAKRPDLAVRRAPAGFMAGVEAELEQALGADVALAGGGRLIIERTAALAAIDVDRGAAADPQAVNLAAAAEAALQIRLRRLAGLIAVDFLRVDADRRAAVQAALAAALGPDDPAQILGWTRAGLLELTRPHRAPPLASLLERACPACGGRGRVASPPTAAAAALRAVEAALADSPAGRPAIAASPDLVGPLEALADAAQARTGRRPSVAADPSLAPGAYHIHLD